MKEKIIDFNQKVIKKENNFWQPPNNSLIRTIKTYFPDVFNSVNRDGKEYLVSKKEFDCINGSKLNQQEGVVIGPSYIFFRKYTHNTSKIYTQDLNPIKLIDNLNYFWDDRLYQIDGEIVKMELSDNFDEFSSDYGQDFIEDIYEAQRKIVNSNIKNKVNYDLFNKDLFDYSYLDLALANLDL